MQKLICPICNKGILKHRYGYITGFLVLMGLFAFVIPGLILAYIFKDTGTWHCKKCGHKIE